MEKLNDQLEGLIDSHGLAAVIETIGDICFEKAAHIRENWQDHALADVWHKNSKILSTASIKLEKTH